jgi:hypothetical protein
MIRTAGLLALAFGGAVWGQSPTVAALSNSIYLKPGVTGHSTELLAVYGTRLQRPGNERLTLTGTFSSSTGNGSATVTAQIPGQVSVQISGPGAKTLQFDGTTALSNGASATGTDLDWLESFQSDTIETFFYSAGKTATFRFLGSHFRTDNGKTASYTGPYYDIFELVQPVAVKGSATPQQKFYYFDSSTRQFVKTRYRIVRGGQTVEVQTLYSNWTKSNGQSMPGQIQRLENGVVVFTMAVSNGQFSAGAQDGIFSSKP